VDWLTPVQARSSCSGRSGEDSPFCKDNCLVIDDAEAEESVAGPPPEDASERESWTRQHKLTVIGAVIAVIAVVVPAGIALWNRYSPPPVSAPQPTVPTQLHVAPGAPVSDVELNAKPCTAQRGALGRVCIQVRPVSATTPYGSEVSTVPGDFVNVYMSYVNGGTVVRNDVVLQMFIDDPAISYLPDGARVFLSGPDGDLPSPPLTEAANFGSYAHDGGVSMTALVSVGRPAGFSCGTHAIPIRFKARDLVGTPPLEDTAVIKIVEPCK